MYYYYLNPLYTLKENMTAEDFEQLFKLIRQANKILAKLNRQQYKIENINKICS